MTRSPLTRWAAARYIFLSLTAALLLAVACDEGNSGDLYRPPVGNGNAGTVVAQPTQVTLEMAPGAPTPPPGIDLSAKPAPVNGLSLTEMVFEPAGERYPASPLRVKVKLEGTDAPNILAADLSVYDQNGRAATYGGDNLNPFAMFPSMEPGWWQADISTPTEPGRYVFMVESQNYQRVTSRFILTSQPLAVVADPQPLTRGLIIARNSNLWLSDLSGSRQRTLTFYREFKAWAKDPAWSPDGRQIAYTFAPEPPDPMSDQLSELWLMNADGSGKRQLAAHGKDENLEAPSWSPDGLYVYYHVMKWQYDAQGNFTGQGWEVRRTEVATGKAETLIQNAQQPRPTADGKQLLYVETLPEDDSLMATAAALPTRSGGMQTTPIPAGAERLMVADLDGKNARVIVGSNFIALHAPTISPDGQNVVFAAIGGPEGAPGPPTPTPVAGDFWQNVGAFFGPTSAEAHGLPWDLWIIKQDGTGLRRLTVLNEDMPYAVWAQDGKSLLFVGATGLYRLDPASYELTQLQKYDNGSHTQMSWRE